METLTFLGTGKAIVRNCYNACFTLDGGDGVFLTDGGGGSGILRQCVLAGVEFTDIREAFVTHAHTDHLLGMVWVVRMVSSAITSGARSDAFTLYGHESVLAALHTMCDLTLGKKTSILFGDKIRLTPVQDGEVRTVAGYDMQFFDILSTKTKQFGFTACLHNGGKLTFTGDEPAKPEREFYLKNTDWALCEAFCLHNDEPRFKAYEKHHATVRDEAELAERLNVRRLILWHTEDSDLPHRKERYTAEAKSVFTGSVYVPDDLETIRLD